MKPNVLVEARARSCEEKCVPFLWCLRQAVDGKKGGNRELGGGCGADTRHTLQHLSKDAAQGPYVQRAVIAALRHDHLQVSNWHQQSG